MNQKEYYDYVLPRVAMPGFPDLTLSGGFPLPEMPKDSEIIGSIVVENIGDADSFGLITLHITKPSYGDTTYTLPAGWVLSHDDATTSTITTTNVILMGNTVSISFSYLNNSGVGAVGLDARLEKGSGGEINNSNNTDTYYITVI